jgi:PBSX family phage terminase large subunit
MTQQVELVAPYTPLSWQLAPLRDKSKVVLLTGSAGGGKSRAAAEKVHAFCLKYPGAVGIALRKAREFASKSVVYAIKNAIGGDASVRYSPSDLMFHYDNGSRIFVAGMKDEGQRQALRSINGDGAADIIWGEEANALTEDDHNELLGRLRGNAASWRQIIYSTNPDTPYHWIKKRLMDGGEAAVYFSTATENPYNPADYIGTLAGLTGILGKRLRDGQWIQAEGAVYDTFSDAIHIIEPFDIPKDWRRFRVVDFGYTNPFVCQWWAVDPDGRMYLYREIYISQRTVRAHCVQINELSKGETYEATVADHDAEDRATMAENGIDTTPAKKDVSPGIQAVQERLNVQADGKPRLFLFRTALVEEDRRMIDAKKPTCTIQELPGYVWTKTADGRPVKEAPVKENDHGADALRYAAMHLLNPARVLDNHYW